MLFCREKTREKVRFLFLVWIFFEKFIFYLIDMAIHRLPDYVINRLKA
nr:MAG TPA: hypothetical protein [Caudoviricetes sp.]